MSSYLQNLTIRLATGLGNLPEETRDLHSRYFLRAQKDDGGFGGRMGGSDLYYTSFALRGLSILGQLYGEVAEKAADFLRGQLAGHQTIVDFFSLFYAANLLKVSAGIDIFEDSDPDWRDNGLARVFQEACSKEQLGGGSAISFEPIREFLTCRSAISRSLLMDYSRQI